MGNASDVAVYESSSSAQLALVLSTEKPYQELKNSSDTLPV